MGRGKTYPAEAVIELASGLQLGREFLGLSKPATIGGVDVRVVLPNFKRSADGYDFDPVLHRRVQAKWLDFFEERDPDEERQWPFGSVSDAHDTGEVTEFYATRLLALPKGSSLTLEEARQLKRAVDDWVQLLETWIEVAAREDLLRDRVKVHQQGQSAFVWLDRDKGPRGGLLGSKDSITIDFGRPLEITPWQWGKMLKKASNGVRPPEAHVFLRDARHARNIGHFRRSVLDAATAAELSLAKLRDDGLAGKPPNLAKYVEGKAQRIDRLTEFLSAIGKAIPSRVQQEISEPRNKAIHEGREPDEETADKAVTKAEEAVGLAFPWKELL